MSLTKIGSWEIHTKGFGSKILKTYGWKEGKSIGNCADGLIAPLYEINGKFDEKPVKILKRITNPRDEKRFHLINELDKLLNYEYDDDDEVEPNGSRGTKYNIVAAID